MSYLPGNSQIVAKASTQNAISNGDQRARRARYDATSLPASVMASPGGAAGEQALRPPDQHHYHDRVDHERAELRRIIFAGDVGNAEQDRGEKRSDDARGAADRHHDQ